MKRKYPKQNRPSGQAQNKSDADRQPKVAGYGREILSVLFGALAGVALVFASIHYSANLGLAIFWFWLAGILGLASLCFLWASKERHPAIKGVWWFGFFVVSLSCAIWAGIDLGLPGEPGADEMSPTPSKRGEDLTASLLTVRPTPTPSASPRPTSSPVPLKLTPRQIMSRVEAEYEWQRPITRKGFEGMSVDWTLQFFACRPSPKYKGADEIRISFTSTEKDSGGTLVSVTAPAAGNEHLAITETSQKFQVRGIIESVESYGITLKPGATFEPVTDKQSPSKK